MKCLFIIDPIEKLKINTDSTLEIMKECKKSGMDTYYCSNVFWENGVFGLATEVEILEKTYTAKKAVKMNLDNFDLVLMRKEPPYDLTFHYITLLLDRTKTKVINSPHGLRDANEKLVILNFPDIIPNTIVTNDQNEMKDFISKHKTVIKPIHLFGGMDVKLLENASDLEVNEGEYYILQEFLKDVYEGDKRIILLNGNPLGAINRTPKKGDFRSNMMVGGTPTAVDINDKDRKVIDRIKPYLIENGLVLVGIDVIGDKLLEINVTCPTGIVQIKEKEKNITKRIVEYLYEI